MTNATTEDFDAHGRELSCHFGFAATPTRTLGSKISGTVLEMTKDASGGIDNSIRGLGVRSKS